MALDNQSEIVEETKLSNDSLRFHCGLLREEFRSKYPVEDWKSVGFFSEADFSMINCHWLQFEPQKPFHHFALAILYVAIFLVGFMANFIVIYLLVRSPANMLLINLACSDLMMILMVPLFIYNSFMQGPVLGGYGCTIYGFLGGLNGTVSIMTLSAIAMDRYLVLSRPLDVSRRPTYFWVAWTIIAIWIYSFIFASLPIFGFGKYVPEGYLTSCSFDYLADDYETKIFITVYFIAAWVTPLSMICYCYVVIVQAVYNARQELTKEVVISEPAVPTRNAVNRTGKGLNQPTCEVVIAKMLCGLVVLWVVTWTPYAIVSLVGITGYGHLLSPSNSMIPALLAKTAACVNPFVYALNHPKIKREIIYRLFRKIYQPDPIDLGSDSIRLQDLKTTHFNHVHCRVSVNSSRGRFYNRRSRSSFDSRNFQNSLNLTSFPKGPRIMENTVSKNELSIIRLDVQEVNPPKTILWIKDESKPSGSSINPSQDNVKSEPQTLIKNDVPTTAMLESISA